MWAATYLGLNEKGFEKVENIFKDAKYEGIFANTSKPRWWPMKIKDLLYQKIHEKHSGLTWELGHFLTPPITKNDFSKCYVCEKDYPEIVGYTDESLKKQYPMHIRCSEPIVNLEKDMFFEEKRKQKRKK
ncbi:MAG: hypothetical protein HY811_06845 [Planctomycetes bacterium]|nr:hypothetical protein [Planctomycetota bacterium]